MDNHANTNPQFNKTTMMIKLIAIQGSVREGAYTAKALAILAEVVAEMPGVNLEIIDPTNLDLALPGKGITPDALQIQSKVEAASAVILATPEYHGSYSSVMKLVIENMGFPSRLSRKPVALLGVAAGRIGAIKALEHLRSVASHVGAIVLPGPVSIANVQSVFDEAGMLQDEGVRKLIHKLASGLVEYINDTTCPDEAFEQFTRSATA